MRYWIESPMRSQRMRLREQVPPRERDSAAAASEPSKSHDQ